MKAPIAMPTDFYSQVSFDILRVDYSAPEASGRVGGAQAGFPLFTGIWTTDILGEDESDEIVTFKDDLRGATRRFLGRDHTRLYPKAHRRGFAGMVRPDASPFDGTATGWSQLIDGDDECRLTLEGLPVGLTLGKRDYVAFSYVAVSTDIAGLTWHSIARVKVGADADGDGNLTVTVEPSIGPEVPAGAVAYLNEPACVMAQVSDQTKLGPIGKRLAIESGQIVGVQDRRA